MRIVRLELENFRGFRKFELDFHDRLTVLVGVNGSGKTTVLDALGFLLHDHISPFDIHVGEQRADIRLTWAWEAGGGVLRMALNTQRSKGRDTGAVLPWEAAGDHLDLFLKYDVGRTTKDETPGSLDAQEWPPSRAMDGAWGAGSKFGLLFQWFREREDLENQERARGDARYRDPKLEQVRSALTKLLPGWAEPRVLRTGTRENHYGRPVLVMRKHDEELAFNQLSEGERTLIALVGDIARRLAIANPDRNALEGKGVVLIDEIELHLHPRWQAEVLPRLLETFPNLQFIVTTHSPIVLSRVKPESVRLLEDFQLRVPDATYGRDANALLEELFGIHLRPADVERLIDEVAKAIDAGRLDEARASLARLAEGLGTSDREVTRLRSMIDLLSA